MDSSGQTSEGRKRTKLKACRATALAWFTLVLSGCPSVADPYTPLPTPDYDKFVNNIEPFVGPTCGVTGCHGTLGGSLTLYSLNYLRAPLQFSDTPLDEKHLTDAELSWDYDALRIRLRDATSGEDNKLVLKCLDPKLGGIRHANGLVIFSDRSDPDYLALVAWAAGGLK